MDLKVSVSDVPLGHGPVWVTGSRCYERSLSEDQVFYTRANIPWLGPLPLPGQVHQPGQARGYEADDEERETHGLCPAAHLEEQ